MKLRGAREHNLQGVDLDLPADRLVVLTGVSGSGKSSLAIDTIYRESERRFLGSMSSRARLYLGKLARPDLESLTGLRAAIAIEQKTTVRSPRSTVGTLSEVYDALRLLFARVGRAHCVECGDEISGEGPGTDASSVERGRVNFGLRETCGSCGAAAERLGPGLFSFNSPSGACPACRGLGVEDRVAPDLLVADPARTLRTGALVPTTKNEYIVYSQVTMDVLDSVCRQHGFDVDTPWNGLSPEQQHVVLYGSRRLQVPFGKHPIESRMKWSGITARPRELGYYRGLVPVIEETLKRNRNKNILRFVRSEPCRACEGTRLRPEARAVRIGETDITAWSALSLDRLFHHVTHLGEVDLDGEIAGPVLALLRQRLGRLQDLGLGYLTPSRASASLSGGEAQRVRLATQVGSGLQGLLYVLDEPSIGLHARDQGRLVTTLRTLRDAGNDVLVVEHDEQMQRAADWLVDIGPGAGERGGEVLFSGPPARLAEAPISSRTRQHLLEDQEIASPASRRAPTDWLVVERARLHNLQVDEARFGLGVFNVVTGVSGAGKSSLVHGVLAEALTRRLQGGPAGRSDSGHGEVFGAEGLDRVVSIDQTPIGRTPRSHPATYTGIFDRIRTLFADLPEARERSFGRGTFSTNVEGGRCETCQGAGVEVVGMHGLADVTVRCEVCRGRRFRSEVLEVKFRGHSISDVLDLAIEEAVELFAEDAVIERTLRRACDLGLGYLRLGQSSPTLSGGEAQRVKLVTELARPTRRRGAGPDAHTLYILDEPTTGLHAADVALLLEALQRLVEAGHTLIVVEHDLDVLRAADHIVDLGPESGAGGGRVVGSGTPAEIARLPTPTGRVLAELLEGPRREESRLEARAASPEGGPADRIELLGVRTNNLRDLDVEIPHGALTVVTGVSGSGKTSLCFGTLAAEGERRFAECLSSQVRRFLGRRGRARLRKARGLTPTVALRQGARRFDRRSTVGTATDLLESLRLLFSRAGREAGERTSLSARELSFFHQEGACTGCQGLGTVLRCDPDLLVTHPEKSLLDGALDGHKTGRFYGEPGSQHVATLRAVGERAGVDFGVPWRVLEPSARDLAMFGSGEEVYRVRWSFQRGQRKGEHHFEGPWQGFAQLVDEEYARKQADDRGEAMQDVLAETACPSCCDARLGARARSVVVDGFTLPDLCSLTVEETLRWFEGLAGRLDGRDRGVAAAIFPGVAERLEALRSAGLGYLSLDRRARNLSGGEAQRLRIAAAVGSGLEGLTYVLDEPTVGLPAEDTARLLALLRQLVRAGNTVVVVEHDLDVIEGADHVLDLGPGAGTAGGRLVASGTPEALRLVEGSRTGRALRERRSRESRKSREAAGVAAPSPEGFLRLQDVSCHGVALGDVELPVGGLCVVTGSSGVGKSTLVFDVLARSMERNRPVGCASLRGGEFFDDVMVLDQSPFSGSSSSTPATLTGLFDDIRGFFARTERARELGWGKGRFSYLGKQSRCETCGGSGRRRVEMDFLADVHLVCEACQGRRYRSEILEVTWQGRSIADVLDLTVDEAREAFSGEARICATLDYLGSLGLGYLPLGQPASTLSGGEAQRIQLVRRLLVPGVGRTLILLDEPTVGLHADDVAALLSLFEELVGAGHSLIVVEHHPEVVAEADWEVALGARRSTGSGTLDPLD